MAQERPNRLAEWLLLIREQVPVMRRRAEEWLEAVREEPVLIWETAAVRYAAYAVGGLVLLWIAVWVSHQFAPPLPADARAAASTADFHVVCSNPDCEHHFVIHREFGFRGFPVDCPACKQRTGVNALRCNSKTCQGRWVAPEKIDGEVYCPACGRRLQ